MQTNSMTGIIYDYFTSRIRFGYFREGDQLPSIPKIRRQFGVSALTVRAALTQMKENGFIETTERTPATVIFQQDKQSEQEYIHYFLSHMEGMDDICRSSGIIFSPIIQLYFQRQDKASIKRMRSKLKKADFRTAKPIIMLYAEAMLPLNNSLIINLHWEMVRYLSTPYLGNSINFDETNAQAAKHIELILDLLEAEQFKQAAEEAEKFNENVTYQFLKRIQSSFAADEQIEQIPFEWYIYREHPQLCYTLAADIMSKIDEQIYKPGGFLPSCRALSIAYDVSFITARRTISLLNDLGVTESLNGIGARVLLDKRPVSPDFTQPQIRKSLILFLQAMQIGALSCGNVAIHTLSSLSGEARLSLEQDLQTYIDNNTAYLTGGTCLRFIGENSSSPYIREVYSQLYRLMLWGHSLHMFFQDSENIAFYIDYTVRLREKLQNHDIQGFSVLLTELITSGVEISRKILLQLGFDEKQLI